MNFIIALLSSFILSLPFQGIPYTKIDTAFDQKNAEAIVSLAKEKVLMNVLGKEGAYSKSQAILVLKDFFNGKSAGNFNFTFKGTNSASGTFAIGSYVCSNVNYRITMHFKMSGEEYKIESITIEKD
jgi:hypothetical protein